METFQELSLIILSLFASLKLMSTFIHETFLVYKLETFKNCKEAKHIILCDIWLIVENYFQKMLSPSPHEKIHSPFKNSKGASPPPIWPTLHIFQPPTHAAESVGGHCELDIPLLVVLFSITDLDMIYFLRKIFPPCEVLEVCIYSHLQYFFKGGISSVRGWEILGSGNLTRSDSDHLNLLES